MRVKFLFSKVEIHKTDSYNIEKPKIGTVYNSLAEYREASNKQIDASRLRNKVKGRNIEITDCNWRIEKN